VSNAEQVNFPVSSIKWVPSRNDIIVFVRLWCKLDKIMY
jgi:hypothetical protein